MAHPKPYEIRHAISEAIFEDQQRAKDDPYIPPIPCRTLRIIREAISKACDDAQSPRQS